jgi:uncharacterized phage-associated protein
MENSPVIYSATAVANWFIEKNQTDRSNLTHLKLQKLLYYAQGWHLAFFDVPLFEDPIEAWRHGPVVGSLYLTLYKYKKQEISDLIQKLVVINGVLNQTIPKITFNNSKEEDFLTSFWDQYSKIKVWTLVNSTHVIGSPWEQVYTKLKLNTNVSSIIPIDLIKSYFKCLLESNNQ